MGALIVLLNCSVNCCSTHFLFKLVGHCVKEYLRRCIALRLCVILIYTFINVALLMIRQQ